MLPYGVTDTEPVRTVSTAASRFDARRVYTVLVLAPLLIAAILYLPPLGFAGLVFVVGAVALLEFYQLGLTTTQDRWLQGLGLFGFAAFVFEPHRPEWLTPMMLAVVIGSLSIPLLRQQALDRALSQAAVTVFGIVYLGVTLGYLVRTRLLVQGEWLVLCVLLVTWAADTGAYYIGTLYGRHRLAPQISPKKSVEGLIGGLLAALTAAYLARWWFLPSLSMLDCALLGLVLTVVGLWGDLAESALKRSVSVKDSGGVLPGHGGMLDRLDSLLFTAPAFYYYVTVLSRPH